MKRFLFRVYILFGLSFSLIWYYQMWQYQIHHDEILYSSDFLIQYTAGQVLKDFGGSLLYDAQTQLAVQKTLIPDASNDLILLPFNHPPLLAPILVAISGLSYVMAFKLWATLQLIIFSTIILVCLRQWVNPRQNKIDILAYSLSLLLFYPAFISLIKGQDSIFVLLFLLIWFSKMVQKKYVFAGFALSFSLLRPQIALAMALPLILVQPTFRWAFLISAGLLTFGSVVFIGFQGILDFFAMLAATARNSQYIIGQTAMVNFSGMLLRHFPTVDSSMVQLVGWLAYLFVVLVLCIVYKIYWKKYIEHDNRVLIWLIGLSIPFILFFSPHLHYHDLILLIIPILILTNPVNRIKPLSSLPPSVAVVIISMLLLFSDLLPNNWRFCGAYVLIFFLVFSFTLKKDIKLPSFRA